MAATARRYTLCCERNRQNHIDVTTNYLIRRIEDCLDWDCNQHNVIVNDRTAATICVHQLLLTIVRTKQHNIQLKL